jgi:hypothetical protein
LSSKVVSIALFIILLQPVNANIGSSKDLCPRNYNECCYNSFDSLYQVQNQCAPVGQICAENPVLNTFNSGASCGTRYVILRSWFSRWLSLRHASD